MTKDHLSLYPTVLRITSFISFHHVIIAPTEFTVLKHMYGHSVVWIHYHQNTQSSPFVVHNPNGRPITQSQRYNAFSLGMQPVVTF